MRNVIAIISGIITAGGLVAIVESLGHTIYSVPPGVANGDVEAINTYIETAPMGALLFVILAWAIGTFSGTVVAGLIAKPKAHIWGMVIGTLFLLAGIANMVMIPPPTWFMVLGIIVFPVCAFLGVKSVHLLSK